MKKLFIILTILFSIISMTACSEKKPLEINSIADIKVIELQDGNTGEVLLVDSAKTRKTIAGYFTSNDFSKEKSSSDNTGWNFRLKFFGVNNNLISDIIVFSSNQIVLDNSYYISNSENAIDISYLKELISAKNIDVDMIVKDGTLSPSDSTLVFVNNSNYEYVYGEHFKLEQKIDGIWKDVDNVIENYGFDDVAYILGKMQAVEFEINWEWLYGQLKPGEYRIIKGISYANKPNTYDRYYISAEFEID